MTDTIDTGDTVKHGPTGETWVVAYVQGDRLAWCGWPPGEASLEHCQLVAKAAPEYRDKLLRDMANVPNEPGRDDRRKRYAEWRLANNGPEQHGS
jgi:hypothetical protein